VLPSQIITQNIENHCEFSGCANSCNKFVSSRSWYNMKLLLWKGISSPVVPFRKGRGGRHAPTCRSPFMSPVIVCLVAKRKFNNSTTRIRLVKRWYETQNEFQCHLPRIDVAICKTAASFKFTVLPFSRQSACIISHVFYIYHLSTCQSRPHGELKITVVPGWLSLWSLFDSFLSTKKAASGETNGNTAGNERHQRYN